MIIDAHCHLPKNLSLDTFFEEKNGENIDKSVLILNTVDEQNAFIDQIEIAKSHKSKLALLIGYDYKNSNIINTIKNIHNHGFNYGLKLHSRFMHFTINDLPYVLASLDNIDFEVIMVDGFTYGREIETHIFLELLLSVSKKYPNKKVIFAHSGGIDILRTMLCTRNVANIFYDLSLTVPYLFNTSIHNDIIHFIRFSHSRIMFGSDSPDFSATYALDKFYAIFNEMSLEKNIQNNILFSNAQSIYKEIWN